MDNKPCSQVSQFHDMGERLADINARVRELERRCDNKEKSIDILEAWQNKALGYVLALSSIITVVINKVWT